jgi:Glycosyl hydrolase family 53
VGFDEVRGGFSDEVVALAASHGATVLPVLEYAPNWDALHSGQHSSPPKSPGPYARFAATLVHRYGPRGSFWAQHPGIPKVPIRMWQIWNEPNFTVYWSQQPFEPGYVKLLRAAHSAIKAADHGAKVVLAGLANYSWEYLTRIYRIRGARKLFDVVAAHPYTATPNGAVTILGKVRTVMRRFGDRRKPMIASEMSWPSAKGQAVTLFENATTESGQAQKIGQAVRLLARVRKKLGLQAFYYFTWITNETQPGARADPFNFAGLFKFIAGKGTFEKPAYPAWLRAVRAIER